MVFVKSLAGLAIVLGVFGVALIVSFGLFIFGVTSIFGGSLGLIPLTVLMFAGLGLYMSGGVFWYFARNFSWAELTAPDAVADRNYAPVVIEVRLDKEKKRRYLVDSRHSPRSANPTKFGRGVFIMERKRGTFIQDRDVITLIDTNGRRIKNIRDYEDSIHFDSLDTEKSHTVTIASITEHSSNFESKDSWEPLETQFKTKAEAAEAWSTALKKA